MSQELKAAPSGGGASGTVCTKTGLYKASDGKITSVLLVKKNDTFPNFVGSSGTTRTTWYAVTESSDGSRSGFQSVTAEAGAI